MEKALKEKNIESPKNCKSRLICCSVVIKMPASWSPNGSI